MPYRPYQGQNCSIAAAAAVISERWTPLILREVLLGRRRFVELRDELGVASNILSDRLQTLVDQDLLERRRYGKHSEALEYLPTEKAIDLNPVLVTMMQWGTPRAATTPTRCSGARTAARSWWHRSFASGRGPAPQPPNAPRACCLPNRKPSDPAGLRT
jgi:DNA-binding HxlR family transcriptional regulator